MTAAALRDRAAALSGQPNEFDRKRIERALRSRKRYRYVTPSVASVNGGYRIESPCCSRNVDPEGGIIDVALLHYDANTCAWRLFRKNHARRAWEFHSAYDRLIELLDSLNEDPERTFWQ